MNRRDFIRRASIAVAALGIDPDVLFWQPKAMIAVPAMPRSLGVDFATGDSSSMWMLIWDENGVQQVTPRFGPTPIGGDFERVKWVGDGENVRTVTLRRPLQRALLR